MFFLNTDNINISTIRKIVKIYRMFLNIFFYKYQSLLFSHRCSLFHLSTPCDDMWKLNNVHLLDQSPWCYLDLDLHIRATSIGPNFSQTGIDFRSETSKVFTCTLHIMLAIRNKKWLNTLWKAHSAFTTL